MYIILDKMSEIRQYLLDGQRLESTDKLGQFGQFWKNWTEFTEYTKSDKIGQY